MCRVGVAWLLGIENVSQIQRLQTGAALMVRMDTLTIPATDWQQTLDPPALHTA